MASPKKIDQAAAEKLAFRQSCNLDTKIILSLERIRQWHEHYKGDVWVSFSGGKDSTVLLHMVRSLYPDVRACFVDTGLEYPEIRAFVKTIDNVVWMKPKMNFKHVLEKYGYPVVSKEVSQKIYEWRRTKSAKLRNIRWNGQGNKYKSGKIPEKWKALAQTDIPISHKCCDVMKKQPMKDKVCFIGNMAQDSHLRRQMYIRNGGCNSYSGKQYSMPLSFWLERDVWDYLEAHNLPYSEIYNMGYERTGCMFCMFGVHLEKGENRFQKMHKTHPKHWNLCIDKLGCGKVLDYLNIPYHSNGQLDLF